MLRKIAVISYLFPNSVYPEFGIFVLNRLKAVKKYHNVIVVNPIPWFPFSNKFDRYRHFNFIPSKEVIEGIEVYHPRFFIIPRYFKILDSVTFLFAILPILSRLTKQQKFDILDLHWTYPDILSGFVLSKKFKKPFLVTLRGKAALNIFPDKNKSGTFKKEISLRSLLLRKLLPKAEMVICLNHELRQETIFSGVPPERAIVIPNGFSDKNFYYMNQAVARKKLGIKSDRKIILSVGNLIYGKGFDRVFKILKTVQKKIPNVEYYVIGTTGAAGNYLNSLNALIQELKLEKHIKLIGKIDHKKLVYWYNSADVFCLPSRGEGCPNVLLEALGCGCPSVTTNVGDVNDLIDNDLLGNVVPHNREIICQVLIDALQKKWDRRKISSVMKNRSWDQCAKDVSRVYKNIL